MKKKKKFRFRKRLLLLLSFIIFSTFIFYMASPKIFFDEETILSGKIILEKNLNQSAEKKIVRTFDFKLRGNQLDSDEHEWFYSNFISENYSAIISLTERYDKNYLIIYTFDKSHEMIVKEIELQQKGDFLLFSNGSNFYNKSRIELNYFDKDLEYSLSYTNILPSFGVVYPKLNDSYEYMKYYALCPRADVNGFLRIENQTYLIDGVGYMEHIFGYWNKQKWIWIYVPDIMEGSLIYGVSYRNENIRNIVFFSNETELGIYANGSYMDDKKLNIMYPPLNFNMTFDLTNYSNLSGYHTFLVDFDVHTENQSFKVPGVIELQNLNDFIYYIPSSKEWQNSSQSIVFSKNDV